MKETEVIPVILQRISAGKSPEKELEVGKS
jgi:hypothetical protein